MKTTIRFRQPSDAPLLNPRQLFTIALDLEALAELPREKGTVERHIRAYFVPVEHLTEPKPSAGALDLVRYHVTDWYGRRGNLPQPGSGETYSHKQVRRMWR